MAKKSNCGNPWFYYIGSFFIGTGIGMLFGKVAIGSILGIGVGFLIVASKSK